MHLNGNDAIIYTSDTIFLSRKKLKKEYGFSIKLFNLPLTQCSKGKSDFLALGHNIQRTRFRNSSFILFKKTVNG
jgi:hypothetical protein